ENDAQTPESTASQEASPEAGRPQADTPENLAAEVPKVIVSPAFGRILVENRIALLVSTYDTGKVFLLRATPSGTNVHFVAFDKAMGIAVNTSRLMVGSK